MSSIIPLLNQIDGERINHQIEALAQIGKTESSGVTRLAFSREDFEARKLLMGWMDEAGLEVKRDPVGNIFGTVRRIHSQVPFIACGSHIDTVINAGKYDGIVGTIAGIECARVINAHPNLGIPLQVICFAMEESARFGAGYGFGSRALTGEPITDAEFKACDKEGTTLVRAISNLSVWENGNNQERDEVSLLTQAHALVYESHRDLSNVSTFVELHIEQGPLLESEGIPIGIVSDIAAPTRFQVTFHGVQNHSGTTPMNMRHDALAAAAEAILAVERIANEEADQGIVGTVGVIRAEPGSINAIPGRVELGVDIRGIDATVKRTAVEELSGEIYRIGERRAVRVEIEVLADEQPVAMSSRIVETIEAVCSDLGVKALRMHSGAGHDAARMARVTETAMIFIPSMNGVSHSPAEYTSPQDISLGARVLLGTILFLSGRFSSADSVGTQRDPLTST